MKGHVTALRAELGPRAAGRPDAPAPAALPRSDGGALPALRQHWPEYLMEAAGLGLFMVSACLFATLLEYPGSPVRQTLTSAMLRRVPMGLAMGLTAVAIVYSPWGQRSGAHTMLIMFPALFLLTDAGRSFGLDAFLAPPIDRVAARGSRLARVIRWLI